MVGSYCCVINCRSSSHDCRGKKINNGLSFYRFPAWRQNEGSIVSDITKRRRMAWVTVVARHNITFVRISAAMRVCSRHFYSGKPAYEMLESHPDWAPSLHLGHSEAKKKTEWSSVHRLKRKHLTMSTESYTSQNALEDTGEWPEAEEGEAEYEMLESHADWASLPLGHSKVEKKMEMNPPARRFQRKPQRKTTKQTSGTTESYTSQVAQGDTRAWHDAACEPAIKLESEYGPCEPNGANPEHVLVESGALKPGDTAECGFCKCMSAEVKRLFEENRQLKRELDQRKMTEEFLKADDVKVMYYTGLTSFSVLMDLLKHVLPFLPQTGQILTPFQMLLLTLMRLRLDLPVQHIADLFHVDFKTVSSTFVHTIDVLHARLCHLIDWPERSCLMATMPPKFAEAFRDRAAIILDSFEMPTEEASHQTSEPTYSRSEHNRRVKYLIGITPAGAISYVSKGWRGKARDEHVAENTGLLDKLLPGDVVLSDCAFGRQGNVGFACAEVKMAGDGCRHLEMKDAEETLQISHLRLHVERVISSTGKKYAMLHRTVPNSLTQSCEGSTTLLDKIVSVCCALTNMFPSVVVQYDQ